MERQYFIIALEGYGRPRPRVRVPKTFYVTGVSWVGSGNEICRFHWGEDRSKAARFGKLMAENVVDQIRGPRFRRPARVERVGEGELKC